MALYGSLASVQAQAPRTAGFAAAFAYGAELLREGSPVQTRVRQVPPGERLKTDLGGGIFVIEECYATKLRADGFFESHRKYVDVQMVLDGEEQMELADLRRMAPKQPYHAERDLQVYEDDTSASLLRVFTGQVAVFFPSDVHMPGLRIRTDPVTVRKAVVKIPVEACTL